MGTLSVAAETRPTGSTLRARLAAAAGARAGAHLLNEPKRYCAREAREQEVEAAARSQHILRGQQRDIRNDGVRAVAAVLRNPPRAVRRGRPPLERGNPDSARVAGALVTGGDGFIVRPSRWRSPARARRAVAARTGRELEAISVSSGRSEACPRCPDDMLEKARCGAAAYHRTPAGRPPREHAAGPSFDPGRPRGGTRRRLVGRDPDLISPSTGAKAAMAPARAGHGLSSTWLGTRDRVIGSLGLYTAKPGRGVHAGRRQESGRAA